MYKRRLKGLIGSFKLLEKWNIPGEYDMTSNEYTLPKMEPGLPESTIHKSWMMSQIETKNTIGPGIQIDSLRNPQEIVLKLEELMKDTENIEFTEEIIDKLEITEEQKEMLREWVVNVIIALGKEILPKNERTK